VSYTDISKERDILSFLADTIEVDWLGDIQVSSVEGGTYPSILDNILRGHLSAIKQRRGLSFQVIAMIISFGDKKLNKRIYDIIGSYINGIKALIKQGVESGELRQNLDLDGTATLYFGMIQGLVNIWALSNYEINLEETYESSWNTFKECIKRSKLKTVE